MIYYTVEGPKPRFSIFSPTTSKISKNQKIVDIVCYCLMPNHFHFLVRQKKDKGITEFISKLSNSYTKYFNIKYSRVGPLLQGEFKAVHVENDAQLLHLSRYIHLNPLVNYITKDLNLYKWSSYQEYIRGNSQICIKDSVLTQFQSAKTYNQFILDQIDYATTLESVKHQLIDED